jgi:hypothetical protein
MPVDFMTKHKGRKLIDASVAYLTNSRNRVESDAGDVEGANGITVKPEVSLLEVSALEVPASFMTLDEESGGRFHGFCQTQIRKQPSHAARMHARHAADTSWCVFPHLKG